MWHVNKTDDVAVKLFPPFSVYLVLSPFAHFFRLLYVCLAESTNYGRVTITYKKYNEIKCILKSRLCASCVLHFIFFGLLLLLSLNYFAGQSKTIRMNHKRLYEGATQNSTTFFIFRCFSHFSIVRSILSHPRRCMLRLIFSVTAMTPTLYIVSKASFHFVYFINFFYYNFEDDDDDDEQKKTLSLRTKRKTVYK